VRRSASTAAFSILRSARAFASTVSLSARLLRLACRRSSLAPRRLAAATRAAVDCLLRSAALGGPKKNHGGPAAGGRATARALSRPCPSSARLSLMRFGIRMDAGLCITEGGDSVLLFGLKFAAALSAARTFIASKP
jgi:hypothetical protein